LRIAVVRRYEFERQQWVQNPKFKLRHYHPLEELVRIVGDAGADAPRPRKRPKGGTRSLRTISAEQIIPPKWSATAIEGRIRGLRGPRIGLPATFENGLRRAF
jgi:hypothetical protein